ncbi:MAG TPA: hybrid sensor histidine kinase/response regulator [Polyangiaceae bacterium]
MPRDADEPRPSARWSEPPPAGDPHRDVTGALHDVSNALTVLLGWVAEARAGRGSPEQVDRALAIVEERARTARDLARRAIGVHAVIDDREEPLDAVVGDVVEALAVEAQRAGVSLVVRSHAQGVRVPLPGDASQILTNVLLNALAWAPRGSQVTIETQADGSVAAILVQDQGPGVPTAQVPRIFDGSTSREGGAGVGLRHARAVARAAGGELELVPEGGPKGARFRLRWPRVEQTLPRAPVSAPRPAVLAGTRVLVVEDDADVAALLESALGARGAHVVVARTAEELAVRAIDPYDAALVDLSPIAHDVRGAIDALRRGSPDVALVFISGTATGLPEGLEGERIRWVRKPFEVAEIVLALAETRAGVHGA